MPRARQADDQENHARQPAGQGTDQDAGQDAGENVGLKTDLRRWSPRFGPCADRAEEWKATAACFSLRVASYASNAHPGRRHLSSMGGPRRRFS